ncbi:MAG: EI24 domain-containing protein [Byssovorax sp.]
MTNLAVPGPAAPPAARPGFVAGLTSLFAGFGFVLGTPSVWPLAAVPVVIALGITAVLGAVAIKVLPPLFAGWLVARSPWLQGLVSIIATGLALVLSLLLGFALAQPLSGSALGGIVRRIEAREGAPPRPETGFFTDVGRSLESMVVSYAFGLPILAVLLAVNFVFPPATLVTVPLKMATIALLLAWDLCDYPLSLHGMPIGARVAWMKRNAAAMLGFGAGLSLLSLLPCALVLVLPAGVAGAARLALAIERAEAGSAGPR